MKRTFYLITMLYFLASCSDRPESTENITKNMDTVPHLTKITSIELPEGYFFCVYEMDDKYKNDTVSENHKKAWRQQLFKRIIENGVNDIYDIFRKEGGGPQGGQWNTNANLLCALILKDTNSLSHNYSVLLNNEKFKIPVNEHIFTNGVIVYFTLSSSVWEKKLKRKAKNGEVFRDINCDIIYFVKVSLQIKGRKNYNGTIKIAYGE